MPYTGKRSLYIDILKIFAVYFVIYNHTSTFGFLYFTKIEPGSLTFYINLFLFNFCTIAVPIFLMCSGALLLKKEDSINTLIHKRIIRYIELILVVYALNFLRHNSFSNILTTESFYNILFKTDLCTYYLWLYLAFLIILPFLQVIAKNRNLIKYYISVYFIYVIAFSLIYIIIGIHYKWHSLAGLISMCSNFYKRYI